MASQCSQTHYPQERGLDGLRVEGGGSFARFTSLLHGAGLRGWKGFVEVIILLDLGFWWSGFGRHGFLVVTVKFR
jgi:hypothetical protein